MPLQKTQTLKKRINKHVQTLHREQKNGIGKLHGKLREQKVVEKNVKSPRQTQNGQS